MVTWFQVENDESRCRVQDSLQRCHSCRWKTGEDSVAVVQSRQHESRDQSCRYVTTESVCF